MFFAINLFMKQICKSNHFKIHKIKSLSLNKDALVSKNNIFMKYLILNRIHNQIAFLKCFHDIFQMKFKIKDSKTKLYFNSFIFDVIKNIFIFIQAVGLKNPDQISLK